MDIQTKLADWKARQLKEHLPCPRCGLDKMDAHPVHNALSRHADIQICDACGVEEALRIFNGEALPLEKWACMKP